MAGLKPFLLVEDNPNDIELTLAALDKSQLANEIVICRDGAEALDFLYRRGGSFYHFDGLKAFKQKFGPEWHPHYLVCPGGFDTARALVDVTTLISGRPAPKGDA